MLVVVGGHSRNIGKTTAVERIIGGVPEARWWAFKITQLGHGVCSEAGTACGCATEMTHPFAIDEERHANASDSGRYLAAGAMRSFWVRTAMGELGHALPELRRLFGEASNVVVESNSLLRFVVPDLYLAVVDFGVADWKDSARLFLNRADALVITGDGSGWDGIPERWLEKPRLRMEEISGFVQARLAAAVEGARDGGEQ